jgi:microcystin-dependent protein
MSAPFVAEIRMFACNFAPTGWAQCNGQLLPISQNTALFSLLGTYYGGDGKSTFALPNLQGSAPMMWGQGNGLSLYDLGQQGGSQYVTLLQSEMPFHNHNFMGANETGEQKTMANNVALVNAAGGNVYQTNTTQNLSQMNPAQALSISGGSLPHNNMQPYLTVNFCIAMQGVFPPRG